MTIDTRGWGLTDRPADITTYRAAIAVRNQTKLRDTRCVL